MMKGIPKALIFFLLTLLISGCIAGTESIESTERKEEVNKVNGYYQISQEEAKRMMELDDGHVVVDVRREDEYAAGHIPGAILIPNENIDSERPAELPDLSQIILVYCRSGRRSKEAAGKLAAMGYSNIYEFGGIITWTGETTMETETVKPIPVLVVEANGSRFYAVLEDNSSAKALIEKLNSGPVTIAMHDYGNFEKVGPLPWELPRNDTSITTVPGDVILYQGNQITIYYDENTWNFTRLARIENTSKEALLKAFGNGDVSVKLYLEWGE